MERPLVRLLLVRAALFLVPFAVWFAWAWWAKRSGRPIASTPWAWLVAAAAVLVGASLMATAVFHRDNRGQTYVPAEPQPDGRVTEGHFERQ
jgi:hypothetical protein